MDLIKSLFCMNSWIKFLIYSFVFIISKAEGIKAGYSKKISKFWEEFGNYFKVCKCPIRRNE